MGGYGQNENTEDDQEDLEGNGQNENNSEKIGNTEIAGKVSDNNAVESPNKSKDPSFENKDDFSTHDEKVKDNNEATSNINTEQDIENGTEEYPVNEEEALLEEDAEEEPATVEDMDDSNQEDSIPELEAIDEQSGISDAQDKKPVIPIPRHVDRRRNRKEETSEEDESPRQEVQSHGGGAVMSANAIEFNNAPVVSASDLGESHFVTEKTVQTEKPDDADNEKEQQDDGSQDSDDDNQGNGNQQNQDNNSQNDPNQSANLNAAFAAGSPYYPPPPPPDNPPPGAGGPSGPPPPPPNPLLPVKLENTESLPAVISKVYDKEADMTEDRGKQSIEIKGQTEVERLRNTYAQASLFSQACAAAADVYNEKNGTHHTWQEVRNFCERNHFTWKKVVDFETSGKMILTPPGDPLEAHEQKAGEKENIESLVKSIEYNLKLDNNDLAPKLEKTDEIQYTQQQIDALRPLATTPDKLAELEALHSKMRELTANAPEVLRNGAGPLLTENGQLMLDSPTARAVLRDDIQALDENGKPNYEAAPVVDGVTLPDGADAKKAFDNDFTIQPGTYVRYGEGHGSFITPMSPEFLKGRNNPELEKIFNEMGLLYKYDPECWNIVYVHKPIEHGKLSIIGDQSKAGLDENGKPTQTSHTPAPPNPA